MVQRGVYGRTMRITLSAFLAMSDAGGRGWGFWRRLIIVDNARTKRPARDLASAKKFKGYQVGLYRSVTFARGT